MEALGNRRIIRVKLKREVTCEHDRRMATRRIMRVWHKPCRIGRGRHPLRCTGRAFGLLPVKAEQVVEIVIIPFDWIGGPCAFQSAGDGVNAFATAKSVFPAKALLFDVGAFGFAPDKGRVARTVGFAKGVAARNQGDGFFVIHCHAGKCFADITC